MNSFDLSGALLAFGFFFWVVYCLRIMAKKL
jgi:hypothetical protein